MPTSPAHPEYIVDELFPAEEVHLLAGPSGSGKTTWLFQMIRDWSQGKPIQGFASHPLPWVYIACDRTSDSTRRTLKRVGVNFPPSHIFSLLDGHKTAKVGELLEMIKGHLPDGGVVFLDGIASLTYQGKLNDYDVVKDFLSALTRFCKLHHITIIGTVHATKTKEGERFQNPRQRILGSVAWAGFSDTVVIVEPSDADDCENGQRTLLLLPRNAEATKIDLAFDEAGRLVERSDGVGEMLLDRWLTKRPAGEEITTSIILDYGAEVHVPKRSIERWLKHRCADGKLEHVRKGVYRKVNPN